MAGGQIAGPKNNSKLTCQSAILVKAMKCILLFALTFFFSFGCAAERPGLILQSYPFNPAGKAILVQRFDFSPQIATNVNQEAVRNFGEAIALDIQRYLRTAGFRHPLVIDPGELARGDVLIRGTISRVDGGNAQQRKLGETFGFGATEVTVTGEVIDLPASRSVLAFSFTKQSPYTWLENEAAVRENLRQIAQEVATALTHMQK